MTPALPKLGLGWREVALSLASSFLLATGALIGRTSDLAQTAEAYYSLVPAVRWFRTGAAALDVAVLVTTLTGILLPRVARGTVSILLFLCLTGIVACWSELLWARQFAHSHVFLLRELPFKPLANFGLGGAVVFATYVALKIPSGKLPPWQTFLVQTCIAVSSAAFQFLVWAAVGPRP
ncbi:MAG: hypothetical protein JST30_03215 [Armatimonadetes bacterium]|nr:hypothetical protein [Armatimonadota bacterium]